MRTQRIRDPIHDLIVFEEDNEVDELAWKLLETAEFQRLRRIKQLGLSEFVFPGATHTRFAHSVGVFHNARRLIELITRESKLDRVPGKLEPRRIKVAALAALLHDIGHGPFSHAFEGAQRSLAEKSGDASTRPYKSHEQWTSEIIESESSAIGEILREYPGMASEIAKLIRAETPTDMYHAIVSSSFDADRLDYLQRDRYMTGTGSAAIDLTWLLDNIRVANIDVSPAGEASDDPVYRHSFSLLYKAREAAEDFLLARYRLYSTVYFHKTTRGIEKLLSSCIQAIAVAARKGDPATLGLTDTDPLVEFFAPGGGDLKHYVRLDDAVVWSAVERMARSNDPNIAPVASRLRSREKPLCIDIETVFPDHPERQRRAKHRLDRRFQDQLGIAVFKDEAKLTLYGQIGADDAKAQKRVMVQLADGDTREITDFSDAMVTGSKQRTFTRYYFLAESDYESGRNELHEMAGGN